MNPATADEVIEFVARETRMRASRLSPSSDLARDVGLDGQDAEDLIAKFAATFHVNMAGFDFGTHFGPEGLGCVPALLLTALFRGLRRNPAPRPVPVTIRDLIVAAELGKWPYIDV